MRRFGAALAAIAGAIPLVAGYPLYRLAIELNSQIAPARTLGVLGVHAAVGLVVAAAIAGAVVALGLDRKPRLAAVARFGVFAGAIATLAVVGLSAFYLTPRFAPKPVLVAVGVLMIALFAAYRRYTPEERAFVSRALQGLGLGAIALPLLATPYVAAAAMQDRPRLAVNPPTVAASPLPGVPKRVVLVTFDGMRARSTSLATPALQNTPHMAALAEEATVYTRAKAASDRTLVSCLTMLTGLRPSDIFQDPHHQANQSGFLRQESVIGLPGRLRAAGYHTAYSVMMIHPGAFSLETEFDRGYSANSFFYENRFNTRHFLPWREALGWWGDGAWSRRTMHEMAHDEVRGTRDTFDRARRMLQEAPDKAFVWVHVGAPHFPYFDVPAEDLGGELHPERYPVVTEQQAQVAGPEEAARYEAVYERYVKFADAEFGRFLDGLKADGRWDDTMLLVSSDHGESFQPKRMTHSVGVALEDVMSVPLIVREPGQTAGRRVEALAAHEDLVPTVIDRVFGQVPPGFKGRPLHALGPDRVLFGWAPPIDDNHARVPRTVAVWQGGHKLLEYFPERARKVYDLEADPLEATPIEDEAAALRMSALAREALSLPSP